VKSIGLYSAAALAVLNGKPSKSTIPEKWDGHAASRIVDILLSAETPESSPAGPISTID